MDQKVQPPFKYFEVIQGASSIVHLLQKNFQNLVLPCIVDNQPAYRQCMIIKNHTFMILENLINSLLQKFVSSLVNWLSKILARQKKTDYKLKEGVPPPVANFAAMAATV